MVQGPVANDKVFTTVNLFESGMLSAEAAILQLKAYKTYDQLSFHTTRVIVALKFVEAIEVWHPIKSDWRDGTTIKSWKYRFPGWRELPRNGLEANAKRRHRLLSHQTFIRHPGFRAFPVLSLQNQRNPGIHAVVLRNFAFWLLTKVTWCSRQGWKQNIQKMINNGSKSDEYQIFFVSLPPI